MKRILGIVLALILIAPAGASAAQTADTTKLVDGNTAFAFEAYAALADSTDGNLIFSPYSVSQALAMTYAGANGETATQMADTLSFTLPEPALHDTFGALNADLIARGNGAADPDTGAPARELRIANALWGEQTYPFSQDYSDQLAQSYGAGLQETDFKNAPEQARDDINGWVADQTNDHIQDIVPEDVITSATRLVLANAIYFNGGWADPFDADSTEDGDFHLLDGSTVTAPFMVQQVTLRYAVGDGFTVIEFPYAGSGLVFTVILPDEGKFDAVQQSLDPATLSAAIAALIYTEVVVYLPKFKFDYGASLAGTLQAMGMTDAFDPDRADFTGMMDASATEPLVIGDVLHKAFISVDENGTEAAAATVVEMEVGSAAPDETEPPEIHIDRPFLFVIGDTQTGTVLFMGRVMDPTV